MKICKIIGPKYKFGYYGEEDMIQEAFIIAMKAIEKFDESKSSLETFLTTHLHNRLRTFKRDNYVRKDFQCKHCGRNDPKCEYCQQKEWKYSVKKHLIEPIDIDNVNDNFEKNMRSKIDILAEVELNELSTIINQNLDIPLRDDYLKMLHGVTIPRRRRMIIESNIIKILEEYGYYDD